jgi:hypothetical protein
MVAMRFGDTRENLLLMRCDGVFDFAANVNARLRELHPE